MEKLIKLLDEYDHKKTEDLERWKQRVDNQKLWIISKQFWFIYWLVKQDKIDIEKIENSEYYLIDWFYYNERKKFWIEWLDDVEKILLMLLSISDTPIDDLILYLK